MITTDTLVDADVRGPLTEAERSRHALPHGTETLRAVRCMVVDGTMPNPDNSTTTVSRVVVAIFADRAQAQQKSSPIERVADGHGPYSIGSTLWPGLSKVAEESGEIVQVIGKLMGTGGLVAHWDGSDLAVRMQEEIADLQAALEFLVGHNAELLDRDAIAARAAKKLTMFEQWHGEAAQARA